MSDKNSETISRLIIDKLISNVILENKIRHANSVFNSHIEKFIFKIISPFLKSKFLLYDKDLDKIEDENIIFFEEKNISKVNTWLTVPEPKTCQKDRFTSQIKLIKPNLQNNDGVILDNSLKESEFENDIKNNKGNNKNEKTNKRNKNYRNKILKLKFLMNKQNIDLNDDKIRKEKKKEPILEIPGIYIPYDDKEKINILLNDTEENKYLRKEWKLNMIEKEKKLLKEQLIKKNARPKLLINKEMKLINSHELTFDSNGKILKLNLNKVNSLKQDFLSSKVTLKNKKEAITPIQTSTQLFKKSSSTNKRRLSNVKLKDINNQEIVEYNEEEKMNYINEFNDEYFKNKKNNQNKNIEKQILSGSNFEKMRPEIGVIISNTDNGKKKEKKSGGFDYIKKYNRPSMNELSQFLSSSNNDIKPNNNNSNNKMTSFLYSYSNTNNNNDYKTKNNYIGYKEHFNDERNPLFQNAFNLNDRKSRNLLLKREIGNKKSLSNENIFRTNKIIKKGKSYNNIILLKDEQNFNGKDINSNYLSSVNNIFLSNKFNFPNLKILFSEENENYLNTDMNKNVTKNLGNIKVMKENKSNLIYSIKDIRKDNKNFLPNINADKNKNILGKDYINKFLINTIQKRNLSYGNLENINDINKENSYKNQFLKIKKNNNKNVN